MAPAADLGTAQAAAAAAGSIRLATYNVEWFNALFDDAGQLHDDAAPSARYQISRASQGRAVAQVFQALDADGIMIIEAPDSNARRSTVTALEAFARRFGLRARTALHGFSSDTEQEIAFLYDPDRLQAHHDPQGQPSGRPGQPPVPPGTTVPRFDGSFRDRRAPDLPEESIQFSKPPLEVALQLPDGQMLRLIGVHAKSKNPHGAADAAAAIRISLENRRKQLAQCRWLRARVDSHLAAGDALVVLGDFNDGPGLDDYEAQFGQSGVETVLGAQLPQAQRLIDPNANLALCSRLGLSPTTARFWLKPQARYFEALLDFIMVSRQMMARRPQWRIWHPFNDPKVLAVPGLSTAILDASDHFPVTLDFSLQPLPS